MTTDLSHHTAATASVTTDVRWKRWLRRVLLVVSCLCLVLAVVTLWLRIQIGNTERFTRTIDPVASNAAIQEALVVSLTDRFSARLSEAQTRDTLVDRDRYLAAPINALLTDYFEQTIRSVVTSDQYQQFWAEAKQAMHPRLSALLTGSSTENMDTAGGEVTLDLSPLVAAVQTRLAEHGLDRLAALQIPPEDVTIVLVDSPELAKAQDVVHVLYKLAVLFPIVALLTLGGYLWLSPNRRSGVIRAGLAVATSMVLLLVLLSAARWRYLDGISSDVNHDAAAAFFDIIGRYFRAAIRLIALLGLVVAGVAFAFRPHGWIDRLSAAAKRRLAGHGRFERPWLERNRAALMGGLLAVACLLIITPDRITEGWWRAILLLALFGLILILLTSRSTPQLATASAAPGPAPAQPAQPVPPVAEVNREGADLADPAAGTVDETQPGTSRDLSPDDRELLDRVAGALRNNE
jgi:hypothetical protein